MTTGAPRSRAGWTAKLDGLAPGIRADTEVWLRTMRDGGPRSRPRDIASAWNHMNQLRPVLLAWSGRYGHLREITRDDVAAVLAGSGLLFGSRRRPQGHGAATGLPRGGYLAPWHPWVKRP